MTCTHEAWLRPGEGGPGHPHLHEVPGQQRFLQVQSVLPGAKGGDRVGKLDPLDDLQELGPDDVRRPEGGAAEEAVLAPLLHAAWGGVDGCLERASPHLKGPGQAGPGGCSLSCPEEGVARAGPLAAARGRLGRCRRNLHGPGFCGVPQGSETPRTGNGTFLLSPCLRLGVEETIWGPHSACLCTARACGVSFSQTGTGRASSGKSSDP